MSKKSYFLIFSLVILSACSELEKDLQSDNDCQDTTLNKSQYEEIISRANWFYSLIDESTRSEIPEVTEIISLSSSTSTRGYGENEIPEYYLINYENEEGFVIVGNNEYSAPMLAVSNESNLNLSDTTSNKGLAAFIRSINDPMPSNGIGIIQPPVQIDISVKPILNSHVRKWGNSAPFNSQTPIDSETGKHWDINPLTISVAQIMSAFEWPTTTNNRQIPWDIFKASDSSDQLETFLCELQGKDYLSADYTVTFDPIAPYPYINIDTEGVFHKMQYEGPNSTIYLSEINLQATTACKLDMMNKLPLMVIGVATDIENNYVQDLTSFIIDGLLHVIDNPLYIWPFPSASNLFYYHCVWGKGGRGNGYYIYDRLGVIGGKRYGTDWDNDGVYPGYTDSDNAFIYNTNVFGYYDFKPLK